MRMTTTMLALLSLLFCAGCANKIDSKLAELAAKPPATTVEGAKALYTEANDFVRWFEDPAHGKLSPEQLAKAEALRDKRKSDGLTLLGNNILSGAGSVLGGIDLKNVDVGKAKDWFIGLNAPEKEQFAAPNKEDHDRGPTDPKGAKGWP